MNGLYLYWVGHEYTLIRILRSLVYLHSTNGIGYKVNIITRDNATDYVGELPTYFDDMCPAHQADYVRVCVICDRGGIWIDSDTLVMDSLDGLFSYVNDERCEGFLIKENNMILWNGVFGSKPNTPLMLKWKEEMCIALDAKQGKINWTEVGCEMLQEFFYKTPELFADYKIFEGLDTMYPVNWDKCVSNYLASPYDHYKELVREFQPLLVLVNSVYKAVEQFSVEKIWKTRVPLNYFLHTSVANMKHLRTLDFIEIGTSNFDTMIQTCSQEATGISIDAVKYYINQLPDKPNVEKLNVAISDMCCTMDVYYIPENVIEKCGLPSWFKGCNTINDYHPLHRSWNITGLCVKDEVAVITPRMLLCEHKVMRPNYLKIDTEGHDCVILLAYFDMIRWLPSMFYPRRILFETNEHCNQLQVNNLIELYSGIGYKVESRGYNTVIVYN